MVEWIRVRNYHWGEAGLNSAPWRAENSNYDLHQQKADRKNIVGFLEEGGFREGEESEVWRDEVEG